MITDEVKMTTTCGIDLHKKEDGVTCYDRHKKKRKQLACPFGLTTLIACKYLRMITAVLFIIIQTLAAKAN